MFSRDRSYLRAQRLVNSLSAIWPGRKVGWVLLLFFESYSCVPYLSTWRFRPRNDRVSASLSARYANDISTRLTPFVVPTNAERESRNESPNFDAIERTSAKITRPEISTKSWFFLRSAPVYIYRVHFSIRQTTLGISKCNRLSKSEWNCTSLSDYEVILVPRCLCSKGAF